MALPNPLSFPIKVLTVQSFINNDGKYVFQYTFEKTSAGNKASFDATVISDTSDQFPIGQLLTVSFSIP